MNVTITVDEATLRHVIAGLEELEGEPLRRLIGQAIIADGILPEARNTPPQSGRRQAFVSAAQRRAFFAKLRSGAITVPYQRTGRLVAAWRPTDPYTVVNEAPYADLVVSRERQAAYHRGNWPTDQDIAAKVQDGPAAFIAAGVVSEFVARNF